MERYSNSKSTPRTMTKLFPPSRSCCHSQWASEDEETTSQYRGLWTTKITKTPIQRGNTNSHACSYTGSNETYFKEHNSDLHTATTRSEETGGLHYNPVTATECDWNHTHAHTYFCRHTCSTSRPHVSTAMLWKHSEHLINSCALTQCRHKLINTVAFKWETAAEMPNYRHPDTNNTNRERCTQTRERRHLRHQHKQTHRNANIHTDSRTCKKNSAQTGKNAKYMQKGLQKLNEDLSWKS